MSQKLTFSDYLAHKQLPLMWCAGCGNGVVLRALAEALAELNIPPHKVVVTTGIGCFGKTDDYMSTHACHGTHGRALAFATGIKLANPELTVLALMGDGDATTIGGNHFINTARRNVDVTAIVANNYNYGMTGGQYSSTTPIRKVTTTSPYGTAEPGFDICELAKAAGANYVARSTTYHVVQMQKLIMEAIAKKGFSLVEVSSPCPTYFGRYNGMPSAVNMLNWLKEISVSPGKYQALSEEEKENVMVIGKLVDRDKPDYLSVYKELTAGIK